VDAQNERNGNKIEMKLLEDGYYIPDGDDPIHHVGGNVKEHDNKIHEEVLKRVNRRTHMIDVGGNVGRWANHYADIFENVTAFEPADYNIECFKINTEDKTNITLNEYGLADKAGKGKLAVAIDNHLGSTRVWPEDDGEIVLKTMDEHNYDIIDVLKIDVEGLEIPVLNGARKTLERCSPVIIIERCVLNSEAYGYTKNDSHELLVELGYKRAVKVTRDCIYVK